MDTLIIVKYLNQKPNITLHKTIKNLQTHYISFTALPQIINSVNCKVERQSLYR